MISEKISVVVCARNEEGRIEECLKSIVLNQPDEIILVDGDSNDRTIEIASKYVNKTIKTTDSSLTRDRQIGINNSRNDLVAMIDADHRLEAGNLQSLLKDLKDFDLAIVQSQLVSFENHGFWDSAEEECWDLVHNIPGPKKMIGTAPAIYKKSVFKHVQFDDQITSTIDDTDFIYRLSKFPEFKIGIGTTKVKQFHFSNFRTYFKKFQWYGKGDGEFIKKNPNRTLSMLYHLLIRYPVIYSFTAIQKRKFKAALFFVLQGYFRFYGTVSYFLKITKKQLPKGF